jgi:hypothetical protein
MIRPFTNDDDSLVACNRLGPFIGTLPRWWLSLRDGLYMYILFRSNDQIHLSVFGFIMWQCSTMIWWFRQQLPSDPNLFQITDINKCKRMCTTSCLSSVRSVYQWNTMPIKFNGMHYQQLLSSTHLFATSIGCCLWSASCCKYRYWSTFQKCKALISSSQCPSPPGRISPNATWNPNYTTLFNDANYPYYSYSIISDYFLDKNGSIYVANNSAKNIIKYTLGSLNVTAIIGGGNLSIHTIQRISVDSNGSVYSSEYRVCIDLFS